MWGNEFVSFMGRSYIMLKQYTDMQDVIRPAVFEMRRRYETDNC